MSIESAEPRLTLGLHLSQTFKLRDLHRDAGAPGQLGRITNDNPPYGSQYMMAQGESSPVASPMAVS